MVLGLAPVFVLMQLDQVTRLLTGYTVGATAAQSGWLFVVATSLERASYSPALFLLGIVTMLLLIFVLVRKRYHGRVRRGPAWDCGYAWQTARMQDTAEGFGQPIRHMFGAFFHMERDLPSPSDTVPRYRIHIEDRLWRAIYLPVARSVQWLADEVSVLQGGRLSIYLLFSFLTLLGLLVFVL